MGLKKIVFFLLISSVSLAQGIDATLSAINSSADEQNPIVSADGKTLFITRSNHVKNIGGLKDPGDVWIATAGANGWSEPVHAGNIINNAAYNTVVGTSADGKRIVLAHHVGRNGAATTQGLSVSTFINGAWATLENIQLPYFHSRAANIQGQLSADGNHFVYAADSYGTLGVEDIYVIHKTGASWSEPHNLGSTINTTFQELAPSLNATNDTLYFSSNGRRGQGSFDVYYSTRLNDWSTWSEPVNISVINTEGRELYYKPLGSGNALYTSTRNSDGYGDVKFYSSGKAIPRDTTQQPVILPAGDALLQLTGKVLDSKTQQMVSAALTFRSEERQISSIGSADGYAVMLFRGNYQVTIEAAGYISAYQSVDFSSISNSPLELNFYLLPIEKGATVNLKNVLFKQSSTDMLEGSRQELDVVVSFMKANPKVKILLTGHTDNRGILNDNVKLSRARVEKVKDYLVAKGIASNRVKGKGVGGISPIASNDTDEGRKLNRRVEFTILKN